MRRQRRSGTFGTRNVESHATADIRDRMETIAPPPNVRGIRGHSFRSCSRWPRTGLCSKESAYSTVKLCMKAK